MIGLTREEQLAVRGRMMARKALETSDEIHFECLAPLTTNTESIPLTKSALTTNAPLSAVTAPPLALMTSVDAVDRCRSLRERIYDRVTAPTRPAVCVPMSTFPNEPVRDMYSYEAPFPVRSVYEVERVTVRPNNDKAPQTLLMAAESATFVRTLEERLGQVLQRNAVAEEDLAAFRSINEALNLKLVTSEKEKLQLEARNQELLKQVESVRKECVVEVDNVKAHCAALTAQEVQQVSAKGASCLAAIQLTLEQTNARLSTAVAEKIRFEELLNELRGQLVQNAQSLQTSTLMVKQLTMELLASKQQSVAISSGYRTQEQDSKGLKAKIQAQESELLVLRPAAATLASLTAAKEGLVSSLRTIEVKLLAQTQDLADYTVLKQKHSKAEADLVDKSLQLTELKTHVDQVRAQANAAYMHAKGFNADMAKQDFTSGATGQYGGAPPAMQRSVMDLRREMEMEERRAEEESRRWKQKSV